MSKSEAKTAQDIQDNIFRRMSVSEKIRLTWDFSQHLMGLNKKWKNGIQRIGRKNRKNFIRPKN